MAVLKVLGHSTSGLRFDDGVDNTQRRMCCGVMEECIQGSQVPAIFADGVDRDAQAFFDDSRF